MTIYFLDSSALVKRYVSEVGSLWVLSLFNPVLSNEIFIAAITGVEIIAAVTRRARGESISFVDAKLLCNQLRNDLQTEYQIVEITENIIISAMALAETYGLRGYDAIQLATCLAVNVLSIANSLPSVTLISADKELNLAASSEGLVIENPNTHL
ncbi:type II toxin-antitoxin system VapC family toxin [Nostoc sp. TCL26-01]|uniref:type II toxin-antitoxin system VapC family toxin n=1 Tax=Nostoc sp. TCL26-01 TaxID=2576904 RepID=UPI0015BC188E|nr:type II toxin-antitoxin system VapC family toxin [Nostoc sp. TCL26-01]QLE55870.1 type II toxin-antitoxin system VapC family toxin [Nostoc sp. TCL26-01]